MPDNAPVPGRGTWVYLVGSPQARPVRIGATTDIPAHLRGLQAGSPVPLYVMWQTRGGRALEGALHERFEDFRRHGDWYDFGDEHPVALVATAAVDLGYRALPPLGDVRPAKGEATPPPKVEPKRLEAAKARKLACLIREAFAHAGDPEHLTVADTVDFLREKDPDTWGQWDARRDRLTMAGRAIATTFRAARCDVGTIRLNIPGRPTAYLLDHVIRAIR
ncbi:GIY-YIG nuclease family protein [Streptomyces sp. NPDC007875]|uniref:GIY-YIG nuclease family protein n=1 Tax=Streptomyces sp. NPDC007875 TaxID=3364783 RepID=UPI0036AF5A03